MSVPCHTCSKPTTGRRQYCSSLCQSLAHVTKPLPPEVDLLRARWAGTCILCGETVEDDKPQYAQLQRTPQCPRERCGGRLFFDRSDVGGLGNFPTQDAHRPTQRSTRKMLHYS